MTHAFGRENNVNEHWDPASVQLPQIPTLPPGEDPMSAMISAALPTLSAEMESNVAALQGKETIFAGKVAASNAMYSGSEDSGQQGVMQIVQMLGQMGSQAGEAAGAPTQMFGQMGSQFGQLMQPMMQAFQGSGHGGHEQAPGGQGGAGGAGQGLAGMGGAQQQEREEDRPAQPQPETQHDSDRDGHGAAGPQAGPGDIRHGLTPLPTLPPEPSQHSDRGDLGRNL